MNKKQAVKIVEKIIDDLISRRGIGDEYEQCDEDVQEEIHDSWVEIVLENS